MMRGSPGGVSLSDIEAALGVSNATARRLRDTVREAIPGIVELDGEDGRKRWRIPAKADEAPTRLEVPDLRRVSEGVLSLDDAGQGEAAGRLHVLERRIAAAISPDLPRTGPGDWRMLRRRVDQSLRRHRRRLRRLDGLWREKAGKTRTVSVDQAIRLHLAELVASLPGSLLSVAIDGDSGIRSFAGLPRTGAVGSEAAAAIRSFLSLPGAAGFIEGQVLADRRVRREVSAMVRRHGWANLDAKAIETLHAPSKVAKFFKSAMASVLLLLAGALWINSELPKIGQMRHLVGHPSLDVTITEDHDILFEHPVFAVPVSLDELPDYLIVALVEMEDRRFFEHPGFDLIGIARAFADNLRAALAKDGSFSGGSTLTQQVARNVFLTQERTIMRKLREAVLALKLELFLEKRDILELYLNRVYFGNGVNGIEIAARRYFAVRAGDLNLYQAAMLVGIVPRPSAWNPERNLELAHWRARHVLNTLVERGAITRAQSERAIRQFGSATLERLRTGDRVVRNVAYQWFRDWIAPNIPKMVPDRTGTFRVVVTLDPLAQIYAQLAAERVIRSGRGRGVGEVACVAVTQDGSVRAMVGGADYQRSQFNRATQARRQPASAFKPFVYLAALEMGYGPDTLIDDSPMTVNGRPYPANFDRRYHGRVRLEDALVYSLNAATVKLQETVGRARVIDVATRLGLRQGLPDKLSLALGSGEVTPLDLTAAYAVFAAGGRRVKPYGVIAIQRQNGSILYWRDPGRLGPQIVESRHVDMLTGMLREALRHGTGRNAAFARDAAGKTGTSQDYRDAWFVGYTADLAASFWLGNDDNRPMQRVTGGSIPALYWKNFMANIYQDRALPELPGIPH
jgi:penicillin-binding protein 1A